MTAPTAMPSVSVCRICGCPVQRVRRGARTVGADGNAFTAPNGDLMDGVIAHYAVVHPDRTPDDDLLPTDWWARQGHRP